MFLRVKRGGNKRHPHDYLQIVESYRDGRTVRQRVICSLGRLDQLKARGQIDGLVKGFSRFSERLAVIEKVPDVSSCRSSLWGPVTVFERLWREQGLDEILGRLSRDRRYRFDIERVAFALSLHRILAPGSDLACTRWLRYLEGEGLGEIALQHLYRTVGFLSEVRADLERELFLRDRDLFSTPLDLMFLDVTSTYGCRDRETPWRKRGHSRDHQPDLLQVVVAVVVDRRGWPISWEVFPGNTHDTKAFRSVVKKLRERFEIGRVIVVCDRGMTSEQNLALLAEDRDAPMDYIVGCRMRNVREVREEVLSRRGRYHEVSGNLKVRAVRDDARFDGKFVLRTNPDLSAEEVARACKSLWRVERAFRENKTTLQIRPIFHHVDSQCIGHIITSFLALRLEMHLERSLEEKGVSLPWAEVIDELKEVRAVNLTFEGKAYRVRTDIQGPALWAYQAAGVKVPARVCPLPEGRAS